MGLAALVLILGGAYTSARVPLGFWLQDRFDLGRNPYDKIGHFMQSLVPAIAACERLLALGQGAEDILGTQNVSGGGDAAAGLA